jgi:LemA protein
MGTKVIVAVAVVVVVILAIGALLVGARNSLYTKRENVDAKWAEVEVQLQRRADLIPQLVSVVQGALTQEQVVFGQIANARAGLTQAMQGGNRQQVIDADNQLTSALGRINFLSITEAYPELKSNEAIVGLQKQVEGTENRLNVARGDYNRAVQDYNTTRGRFPAVLVAGLFGYEREDAYYKSAPGAEQAPTIDLNRQNRAPAAPAPAPAPAPGR